MVRCGTQDGAMQLILKRMTEQETINHWAIEGAFFGAKGARKGNLGNYLRESACVIRMKII
jgi:hypothetical protein